jgi:hypothetical protein
VAEIRRGVKDGIRGPIMLKWVEQLLHGAVREAAAGERAAAAAP